MKRKMLLNLRRLFTIMLPWRTPIAVEEWPTQKPQSKLIFQELRGGLLHSGGLPGLASRSLDGPLARWYSDQRFTADRQAAICIEFCFGWEYLDGMCKSCIDCEMVDATIGVFTSSLNMDSSLKKRGVASAGGLCRNNAADFRFLSNVFLGAKSNNCAESSAIVYGVRFASHLQDF